jgi:hypothetical protein
MDSNDYSYLFDELASPKFFGILSRNETAKGNFFLLCAIDDYFNNCNKITISRQELTDYLNEYIRNNSALEFDSDIDNEDGETISYSKSAAPFINKLIDTGWLIQELYGFSQMISRSRLFVVIIDSLKKVCNHSTHKEYTSEVVDIYHNIENIIPFYLDSQPKNTDRLIGYFESIETSIDELSRNLQMTNENIAAFIRKDQKNTQKTIEESLSCLLNDYQNYSDYIAFTRLIDVDNPDKFKGKINEGLDLIKSKPGIYIDAYIETKQKRPTDEDFTKVASLAEESLKEFISKVEMFFGNVDSIIKQISVKNKNYVDVNYEKLKFKNTGIKDLSSQINKALSILKNVNYEDNPEFSNLVEVPTFCLLDSESIYKPRSQSAKAPDSFAFTARTIDPAILEEVEKRNSLRKKFNRKAVVSFALRALGNKETIQADQIDINNKDELFLLVLIPAFARSDSNPYKIKALDKRFNKEGFDLADFVIEKENINNGHQKELF